MNKEEQEIVDKYFVLGYPVGTSVNYARDDYDLMDHDHSSHTFTLCKKCASVVPTGYILIHTQWHESLL